MKSSPVLKARLVNRALGCLLCTSLMCLSTHAQTPPASSAAHPSKSKPTLPHPMTPLEWGSITPAQQLALKPLVHVWPKLNDTQKKKWLAVGNTYSNLSPDEKNRLQERMVQWAALTPHQRTQARVNFAVTQKIPSQDKNERWEVYQAFTPEQKKTMAASAPKLPLAAQVNKPIKPQKPLPPSSAAGLAPTAPNAH